MIIIMQKCDINGIHHLLHKYLLIIYYVPGALLGTEKYSTVLDRHSLYSPVVNSLLAKTLNKNL